MKHYRSVRIIPRLRLLQLVALCSTALAQFPSDASSQPQTSIKDYGELPLAFEANRGQSDEQVRFISRGHGFALFLTSSGAVLALHPPLAKEEQIGDRNTLATASQQTRATVLRLKLAGAKARPEVIGMAELPGKANYFIGNDPSKWRRDVSTYAEVKYREVYPGVDMVYHANQHELEYDLVVAPGADPEVIALCIDGSTETRLNPQGDLVLGVDGGEVVMRKPEIYQESNGIRQPIEGGYTLERPHQVGFHLGAYDKTKPVVIDPVLVYSTFIGGGGHDAGTGIAVDSARNAYITGVTASPNFPTAGPAQAAWGGGNDVFVAKLNPAGNVLIYSTYLGSSGGEGGNSIAVDSGGNAYITGVTDSTSFPTVNPFQASRAGGEDAFVAKLNATGNTLLYCTYLGGTAYDNGNGIAINGAGNAYITGDTASPDFPMANPLRATAAGWEAFVTKFSPAGNTLVYSTFLGGGNYEYGMDIALDGAGNACVTGWTNSTDFPTLGPAQATNSGDRDVFAAKLNAAGTALLYATYLGGSDEDVAQAIVLDGAGNAYLAGRTRSTNFPTTNATQVNSGGGILDTFVAKLNAAGNAFTYSTYLGGSGDEVARGIAVDGTGSAYVTGYTSSTNFPTLSPLQPSFGGPYNDAFILKLDPSGALNFSTYLGGTLDDQSLAIALDTTGGIYLTGKTYSPNYPTVNPFQAVISGDADVFVTKISFPTPAPCVDPPNTTMVAWYPFDETTGTTAANLATGNSGRLINSPTHVPGKVAKALRFDGVNDHVVSPSTIVTNIGDAGLPQTCSGSHSTCRGDFSIDAWIKVDSTASMSAIPIVDKRITSGGGLKGYHLFLLQRNKLGLQLGDGVGSLGNTTYMSPVIPGLPGNWHHIAVTVSRRSAAGIKWYKNGVAIGTSNPTVPVSSRRYGTLANNSPLHIGGTTFLTAWFKGDIDELEIFNRELTAAEVQGIYNAGVNGKCK